VAEVEKNVEGKRVNVEGEDDVEDKQQYDFPLSKRLIQVSNLCSDLKTRLARLYPLSMLFIESSEMPVK
jgi:hypothetical protein